MTEIDNIRKKFRHSSKIMVAEFAYCALLFFVYHACFLPSKRMAVFYVFLLIALPLGLNVYIYLKNRKIPDVILASQAVITQILILIFSFKFLIKIPCFE